MAEMSVGQACEQFSELIHRVAVGQERIMLTRRRKAIAAIVPVEDLRLLQQLEDRYDLDEARLALAEAVSGDTVPWEQIKADLRL